MAIRWVTAHGAIISNEEKGKKNNRKRNNKSSRIKIKLNVRRRDELTNVCVTVVFSESIRCSA